MGRILTAVWCATVVAWTGCVDSQPTLPVSVGTPPPAEAGSPPENPCAAGEDVAAARLARLGPDVIHRSASAVLDAPLPPLVLPGFAGAFATAQEIDAFERFASQSVDTGAHLAFLPCDVDGARDRGCVEAFVEAFALRLFRRPIDDEERTTVMGFYDGLFTSAELDPAPTLREAVDAVASVLLQSPQFLYLNEQGSGAPAASGLRSLSSWERASRLSFFLWESGPDEQVLQSAAAGELDGIDGMRALAQRMLDDPRAEARVRRFTSRWLGLDATDRTPSLELRPKSLASFPFDSPALRTAMRDEVESLYAHVLFRGDAQFSTLLTSRDARVTSDLAAVYGLEKRLPEGSAQWAVLPVAQRAGLFTRAAFLANFSGMSVTSPIARGVHLSREVLCQDIGDPPGDVNNTPTTPYLDTDFVTTREAAERRTAAPACLGCHVQVNPLGFAFEHYDAIGGWRNVEVLTVDGGTVSAPIDATAEVTAPGFEVKVADAVALSDALAQSGVARGCHAQQWFEAAIGRTAEAEDACTLHLLKDRFARSGDLRALLVDIAVSAPMRLMREPRNDGGTP